MSQFEAWKERVQGKVNDYPDFMTVTEMWSLEQAGNVHLLMCMDKLMPKTSFGGNVEVWYTFSFHVWDGDDQILVCTDYAAASWCYEHACKRKALMEDERKF